MSEETAMPSIPHSSLYVGDLHPSVDERILVEKFGQVGPISHARVCRDITTKYSLGYAYVNFYDPKDAERALQLMNYEMFCNRPIRLMWSQRDPSLRKSGKGNIYIKNLAKNIAQKELYDTFETFGKILSSKIAVDDKGNSKGFGYVHFESEEAAQRAIKAINGMSIFGQVVYVGLFIPKNARKSEAGKSHFNNIYVKSFPPETTDDTLRDMFSEFGEIQSCCVALESDGKSKGFGFVCFTKPTDAEAAVKAMHCKEISGRQLYVNRAQRKEERQEELKHRLEKQKAERQSKYTRGVNLYVKNLDDTIDDAALEEAFASYGSITSAKVMRDAQGRSKGFGFVCFHGAEQATKAIVEMNTFLLGSKPLYVALAQRKDERRQKMLTASNERMTHATRVGVAPMLQGPGPGFFQPAVYPRAAPAYYHQQNLVGSQPRWNRPTGMPGAVPGQLGIPARPLAGHYLGGPNPGVPPGHMVQLTHLRSPGNFPRQMMQGSVPAVTPIVSHGMLTGNPSQNREIGTRASVAQYMAANNQNMATIVANGSPSLRMVQPQQQPRPQQQQAMVGVTNGRFNPQAARGMPNQSAPVMGEPVPMRPHQSQASIKAELGERLFPMVAEVEQERAAKVTGMLLGLEVPEILHLLQSKEALEAKLKEAVSVLEGGVQKCDVEAPEQNVVEGSMVNAEQNRGEMNGVATDNGRKDGV